MAKQWDGAEFFRMMAANEKAVAAMYRQLAADAKFGGKFFEKLAGDEERHYLIYTALLRKFAGTKDLMVEVTDDQEQYLNLLVKNGMLEDADVLSKKAAEASSKDEIYEVAERGERDAVLFVQELIGLYPNMQPEEFKTVLEEEKNHLKQVMTARMSSQLKTLRL